MSNFSLGFKSLIINSDAQNIARFFNLKAGGAGYELVGDHTQYDEGSGDFDDSVAADLVTAQRVVIDGFVTLDKGKVKNAKGSKGIEGQKPEIQLTFALSGVTELTQLNLKLRLASQNFDAELARWDANFERNFDYPLIVKPSEAPAAVIARLEESINSDGYQERPYFKVVSKTATTINITTNFPASSITAIPEGEAVLNGKVTITQTVIKKGFEGRGNYTMLKGFRMETDATLRPMQTQDIQRQGLPVPGKLYTCITFEKDFERPEIHGNAMVNATHVGDAAFELFIDESLENYITAITRWLNANVAAREFWPATTVADATASPETVNKFTAVAASPYTDGLS